MKSSFIDQINEFSIGIICHQKDLATFTEEFCYLTQSEIVPAEVKAPYTFSFKQFDRDFFIHITEDINTFSKNIRSYVKNEKDLIHLIGFKEKDIKFDLIYILHN